MKQKTLLNPAMLDAHFPILQCAFESPQWHAEILSQGEGLSDIGLRTINNDLCYPCIL